MTLFLHLFEPIACNNSNGTSQFAVQIFHSLKAPIKEYYATVFLGAAELIGALTCVFLVHVTGKRPMVFASLIGCGLCFFGAATYANYLNLVPGAGADNVVANSSTANHSLMPRKLNESAFDGGEQTTKYSGEITTTPWGAETTTSVLGIDSTTDSDMYYNYDLYDNSTDISPDNHRIKRKHVRDDGNTTSDEAPAANVNKIILPIPDADKNDLLWLPLTLLIGSAYFAHIGIRLIPWMLIGEVYPVAVRSGASGMSSGIGYIFGFLSNKLFLGMVATLTLPGTFWFYSGVAFVGCIILYFTLPETENKSLIEIESFFVGSPPPQVEHHRSIGAELNRPANGFDQVTVLPPSYPCTEQEKGVGAGQQTLQIGSDNEKIDQRRPSISAVPEIIVSTPRVGSKRFMKSTNEVRRLSNANSGDDSTDL